MSEVFFNLRRDAYSGAAEDYVRGRVPYPEALLDHVLKMTSASGRASMLDLGCGPGRVALRLASHFKETWAVDQEPDMLRVGKSEAERLGITNVRWSLSSAEELQAPFGAFDLITMGESFHRMDQSILIPKLLLWLKPGAYVAAMGGLQAGKEGDEPWKHLWQDLRTRWARPGAASAHPKAHQPAMTSAQIFAAAGFENTGETQFEMQHTWSVEMLIANAYSTSVMSRKALGEDAAGFEADVRSNLLGLNPLNEFPDVIRFWCALGRNPKTS